MSNKIKPNCAKCYYGGRYISDKKLASCRCEDIKEPTVMSVFRDVKYVKRDKWEKACKCKYFIPRLSESAGDFELEEYTRFTASFDCPFCGARITVDDIEIEQVVIWICENCGKKIAVKGKEI